MCWVEDSLTKVTRLRFYSRLPTETLLRVPSRCQQAGPARTWPRERRTLPTWWAEQCVDGCGAVHPWSWRTVVARCRLLEPEVQNHNARTSTANQLTKLSLLYMILMNSKKNYPTWMCTFFYNMFTSFRTLEKYPYADKSVVRGVDKTTYHRTLTFMSAMTNPRWKRPLLKDCMSWCWKACLIVSLVWAWTWKMND